MTFSELTTNSSPHADQLGPRRVQVDRFVVHHAATESLSAVLSMMGTRSREVSSNYVIKDQQIVGVVPEEVRAWSLASPEWDARAITVEVCNERTGDASGWPISEASYTSLASLVADCAQRFGFPIDRVAVLGHREVFQRHGGSYATVCPGGIDLDRVVELAKMHAAGGASESEGGRGNAEQDKEMWIAEVPELGRQYIVTANFVRWTGSPEAVSGIVKLTGRPVVRLGFAEFFAMWQEINAGNADDSALSGERELLELAAQIRGIR
ncbi:N-acetylmuramoyl-L-alanine amidase [Pseudoclavibacter sp. VKM Ac-2888]|uniref:peptidoglycan recognition protein family protein n=1 Tax=Pseudoclavibacter sp. VKM Ac-2888 TaxID=2783830 RepID=UPI00188A2672|nr:N-acetylmuramoyl-L-alanine amidase [Pseudoclavibacter sp. VKM Ac-2888]MBF4551645.1 N-acetylmuramoyl-L-alanine amidase [Pseudoclavibacter sp. VKM Ac-2888]